MRHALYVCTISILFFISATGASAQTASTLQAQVESLLKQIAQLQLLLGQAQSTSVGVSSQAVTPSSPSSYIGQCPQLIRNLGPGASGGDVANLQAYLAADPLLYPEAKITAYYGFLTQQAVARFQVRHNIVKEGSPETTGFGAVGTRTRSAIASVCGTQTGSGTLPTYPSYPTIPSINTTPVPLQCQSGNFSIASGVSVPLYSVQRTPYGRNCSQYMQMRSCSNGILSGASDYQYSSCADPVPNCVVGGTPVAEGTIRTYYSRPSVGIGQSCNSYAEVRSCSNGVMSGSSNYTYLSCATDTPDSCSVNGVSIAHGTSRTLYSRTSSVGSAVCSAYAQTRTCNDGVLSGDSSYIHASCLSGSCELDGRIVPNASSTTFYLANSVPSNEQCSSYAQTRQCINGGFTGSSAYQYASCAPVSSGSCVMDSKVIASGSSGTFYTAAVAPTGATCASISSTRSCSQGVLGGSQTHIRATCTDTLSCSLDGVSVTHGASATFYSARTVAFGTTCASVAQVRTCTNGLLSGATTTQYALCSVNPPTAQAHSSQYAAALVALESILTTLLEWLKR